MSSRRRAREIVLQLLFEADMGNAREPDAARDFIRSRLQGRRALTVFASDLFQGTLAHMSEIDQHLGRLANRWSLSRMAVADRNTLRLGAFEILVSETPGRVAVNEAIVLAKRYGSKDSQRFVNGILDRLLREHTNGTLEKVDPVASETSEDDCDEKPDGSNPPAS